MQTREKTGKWTLYFLAFPTNGKKRENVDRVLQNRALMLVKLLFRRCLKKHEKHDEIENHEN